MLEAGQIEPLNEIYKNAFNLLIGGQGQGKTYHSEELIAQNRHHFPVIKRFSPAGTNTGRADSDGDINDLLQWLQGRAKDIEARKKDVHKANILLRAVREGRPELLQKHNINGNDVNVLLEKYPSLTEVSKIEPALILIDDMGGDRLLRDSNAIFNTAARQLRHMHLTVIFNAHRFKDLPPLVRNNTQTLFLHGGLPYHDLKQIWDERGVPGMRKREELLQAYERATGEDYGHLAIDFYGKKKNARSTQEGTA